MIHIPKGTTSYIISYLDKSGFEMNLLDKAIVVALGYPQSGWIDLKANEMSKADFLYKLTTSKAALKKVTLIPGETYPFFLKQLATKLNLSFTKLHRVYNKLKVKEDGNILAETYYLPYGMGEEHLIFYLINYSNDTYKKFSKKIFGEYNEENWYRYITIASIIQKEAASNDEMRLVSSVVHNRLKKNMKLQMDGTLNYGIYSHDKVTSKMIRTNTSDYNTYKKKGLPSNPVCAVGFDAIKAALFPSKTNYLYFTKDYSTGNHLFTNSYKKHRANTKKSVKFKRLAEKKARKKQKEKSILAKAKKPKKKPTKPKINKKTEEVSVFTKDTKEKKSIKAIWESVK